MAEAFRNVLATERAVALAPCAHRVEALQRESGGIDFFVTGGAGLLRTVFVELLANGRCAARIGIDGRNAWWRRRRLLAEDALHNPRAAKHRRRCRSIGCHLQ